MRWLTTLTLVLGAVIATTGSALACSAAGENTHVGEVLSVDREAGSFSIMDAEKLAALTFTADKEILDTVDGTEKVAIVDYEEGDYGLKALRVSLTE
jgi:hypothetical protein